MKRTFRKRTGGRRKRRTRRRTRRRRRGGRRLSASEINQIKRESDDTMKQANKAAADMASAAQKADRLERHARTAGIGSICNTRFGAMTAKCKKAAAAAKGLAKATPAQGLVARRAAALNKKVEEGGLAAPQTAGRRRRRKSRKSRRKRRKTRRRRRRRR